jgi:hypothetical protein
MWRRSWLTHLLCAGLLAGLLPFLTGCNNPSTPSGSPRQHPSKTDSEDHKKTPDGGIKPPPIDKEPG